jgi:hypothetical protein
MAYDLTAAANGTYRVLGGKQYIYNATSARWERVILAAPDATVTAAWDGKEDNAQVTANQPILVSVKWNQPVTTSQFTQAMVSLTGTGAAIQAGSFVQDSVDSSLYRFTFSFSGAVGQVSIPAGAVSVGGLSNLVTYSEAVPGAYLPYAAIDVVSKNSATYPVYKFNDPNTGQTVRFFTTNMVGTAASAASNRRLQVFFANFSTVGVTSSSFTTTDIRRTPHSVYGVTPTLVSGLYTTVTGTTSAGTTTNPRFAEMYFPSGSVSSNTIVQIGVNASAYTDGGLSNVAVSPIYYGNFLTSTINISASMIRAAGSNNAVLRLYIDHFAALVSNVDISKITLTANGGTISTPQIVANNSVYADGTYGNLYVANYTAAAGTTDFTETVTIAAGLFTIPVGTATSINGLTLTVTPAGATTVPWSSAKTSAATSVTHSVIRSPFVFQSQSFSTTSYDNKEMVFSLNRNYYARNTSIGYTIYTGGYSSAGGTFYYSGNSIVGGGNNQIYISTPWPHMAPSTTYYVEIQAGAFIDTYGNPLQAYNFSVTTLTPGALTITPYKIGGGGNAGVDGNPFGLEVNREPDSIGVGASTTLTWTLRTGSYSGTIVISGDIPEITTAGDPPSYNITLDPGPLTVDTTYYLTIPAGAYYDEWGVQSGVVNYSFTTAPPAANHLIFTTATTYVVPTFQTSITALCIGRGGYSTAPSHSESDPGGCGTIRVYDPFSNYGAGGGGLSWRNNIPVTPGETLYIVFSDGVQIRRGSAFGTILLAAESASSNGEIDGSNIINQGGLGGTNDTRNNGLSNVGGGNGGNGGTTLVDTTTGGGGGGGAGGYTGNGGNGGNASTTVNTSVAGSAAPTGGGGGGGASGRRGSVPTSNTIGFSGGGVGIYGAGSSGAASSTGAAGNPGSGGNGVTYGAGAGGAAYYNNGQTPGAAVVRILWGTGRSFPSTNVSSASS